MRPFSLPLSEWRNPMAQFGDRVRLNASALDYDPGAESTITVIADGGATWTVAIDKDASGAAVSPPDPLPPLAASTFTPT